MERKGNNRMVSRNEKGGFLPRKGCFVYYRQEAGRLLEGDEAVALLA